MTPERALALLTPEARGAAAVDLAVRVVHDPDASVCRIAVSGRPRNDIDRHLFELRFGEALCGSPLQFVAGTVLIHALNVSARAAVHSTGPVFRNDP